MKCLRGSLLLSVCFILVVMGVLCGQRPAFCATGEKSRVVKDRLDKRSWLHVEGAGPWSLYAGPSPDAVDFSRPVLTGEGPGEFSLPAAGTFRRYFCLEQGGVRTQLAAALLPLSGGYNFRDMGGISMPDGKITRWGLLFRADSLAHLTPEDQAYLASIPLLSVVDFRTESEAERSPDKLPASVKKVLHFPVLPGSLDPNVDPEEEYKGTIGDNFMEHLNRSMVTDEHIIAVYRDFFRAIQNAENLPLLFHCSAGKDRTGFAAALILFSLGADKETVMRDYMASATYLEGKYDDLVARHPERKCLFIVKPQYLGAAIATMEAKSGSVERYLQDVLGVDLAAMRRMFLQ